MSDMSTLGNVIESTKILQATLKSLKHFDIADPDDRKLSMLISKSITLALDIKCRNEKRVFDEFIASMEDRIRKEDEVQDLSAVLPLRKQWR